MEVVVDGLGHPDNWHSGSLELQRSGQGAIPADDDQCFHTQLVDRFFRILNELPLDPDGFAGSLFAGEMSSVGGAQNRAAKLEDSLGLGAFEEFIVARRQQSFKSVPESDNLPSKGVGRPHDTMGHRIQSRAIAPTIQDSNSFHDHPVP